MGFLRDAGQGACQFQGATFGFHGGMDIHPQGGLHVGVAQDFGEGFDIHTVFDAACGEGVPLRYNYDKPEKPRISRVFGYLARFFILFQTEKSSREVVIS